MKRRYILVHTHPENLIINPLVASQFAAKPLTLGPPIESCMFSLQADLFKASPIVDALADPNIQVVCLCLRTSDRYGEAARLGMDVVEIKDFSDASWRADDKLPRIEERQVEADEFGAAHTLVWTIYEARQD